MRAARVYPVLLLVAVVALVAAFFVGAKQSNENKAEASQAAAIHGLTSAIWPGGFTRVQPNVPPCSTVPAPVVCLVTDQSTKTTADKLAAHLSSAGPIAQPAKGAPSGYVMRGRINGTPVEATVTARLDQKAAAKGTKKFIGSDVVVVLADANAAG